MKLFESEQGANLGLYPVSTKEKFGRPTRNDYLVGNKDAVSVALKIQPEPIQPPTAWELTLAHWKDAFNDIRLYQQGRKHLKTAQSLLSRL